MLFAEPVVRIRTTLGEGSIWDGRSQVLYWLDIMESCIFVFDPKTGVNRRIPVGKHVGTVVPRASGGLMLAVQDGFAHLDPATGAVTQVTQVATVATDQPGLRFNDGKCDPTGRFWAGTMAYDCRAGAGSLYRLDGAGALTRVLDGVTISNGLAWSRDARVMYYIDSVTRRVDAFDYDDATGAIANRRTVIEIPVHLGIPDGMTMDERGMLWIALHESGKVGCWNPLDGLLLATIDVPGAQLVTSCAFGGANLDELYITTASIGLDAQQLARQPNAGALFRAKPGVRGLPACAFRG
ncbi:MAG: SMP-30/gluconolactonase/LRE family protein [Planctomycetes bacterium]|nr:SMP-30/gluconolactonase/LRE family protein [Planctomycetota bacterium]